MKRPDSKIIRDNPGKTPEELLLNFGLSQEGYEELIKRNQDAPGTNTGTEADQQDTSPTPEPQKAPEMVQMETPAPAAKAQEIVQKQAPVSAVPKISDYANRPAKSQVARVKNLKSGTTTVLARAAAENMARRYPNEFQIVG